MRLELNHPTKYGGDSGPERELREFVQAWLSGLAGMRSPLPHRQREMMKPMAQGCWEEKGLVKSRHPHMFQGADFKASQPET